MSTANSELRFGGSAAIPLVVKPSPRARVMRLRVDPRTREVVLTVPRRVSRRKAIEWASGQRAWIEKALAAVPPGLPLIPGAELPLRGVPHRIEWDPALTRTIRVDDGRILLGGPEEMVGPRLLRWLRQEAARLLEAETHEYAAKAGVSVARVGVGDPTSRWGSCSSSGAIRYSWRLIFAPDHVRRATVAHEVAHRVHMNHGPAFHALVRELFGTDPAPARAWLRSQGQFVHRIGRGL